MWSHIIVSNHWELLFTAACMLLAALCLLIASLYNFYYVRKHKADFYQLFKGRPWVNGASYEHLSNRQVGFFIFNYMLFKSHLKLKRKKCVKQEINSSTSISMIYGIRVKDLQKFEQQHSQWIKVNIWINSIVLLTTSWMFIFAFFVLD